MKTLCVIPARLNSTRLPQKMLQLIQGKAMIELTYSKAVQCSDIDAVVVATDSEEIATLIRKQGGTVVMTPAELATGSDRVAYVAKGCEGFDATDYDVIVNLQGDEPFVKPQMLSELLVPYENGENPSMSTLAYALKDTTEYNDPNIVKVIVDHQGYAIYFSRSPIPFCRQQVDTIPALHHMGLYAYQRDFLLQFTTWPQTPLEKAELLEQLRAIENGHRIRVCKTTTRTLEINTQEELALAQYFEES